MSKTTLETAQQLLATKEFSYKDISPSERGIFLAALIVNGTVYKKRSKPKTNFPK